MTREKSDSEHGPLWPAGSPGTFNRSFGLRERQPSVIQKDFPGFGERDTPRLSVQQLDADLSFKVADLPAQ